MSLPLKFKFKSNITRTLEKGCASVGGMVKTRAFMSEKAFIASNACVLVHSAVPAFMQAAYAYEAQMNSAENFSEWTDPYYRMLAELGDTDVNPAEYQKALKFMNDMPDFKAFSGSQQHSLNGLLKIFVKYKGNAVRERVIKDAYRYVKFKNRGIKSLVNYADARKYAAKAFYSQAAGKPVQIVSRMISKSGVSRLTAFGRTFLLRNGVKGGIIGILIAVLLWALMETLGLAFSTMQDLSGYNENAGQGFWNLAGRKIGSMFSAYDLDERKSLINRFENIKNEEEGLRELGTPVDKPFAQTALERVGIQDYRPDMSSAEAADLYIKGLGRVYHDRSPAAAWDNYVGDNFQNISHSLFVMKPEEFRGADVMDEFDADNYIKMLNIAQNASNKLEVLP